MPLRSYTQPTHARPDVACTARRIRAVRRREYQIAPNVVITIASGIPGKAQRGEIDRTRCLKANGAATAQRSVHTNTAATHTSYRRNAGGSGAAGSSGSAGVEGFEVVEFTGKGMEVGGYLILRSGRAVW
ncbi:MAG: hypothetical protein KF805_16780 [Phycisphaeraceae bacterium]|nr:hypothetical protein [Phycisphaeraceae bacterium]